MARAIDIGGLVVALLVIGTVTARADTLPIEAVPLPPFGMQPPPVPANLLRGPDGALWFTARGLLGRIAEDRSVRYFGFGLQMGAIIVGPDEQFWIAMPENDEVWRFTLQGGRTPVASVDHPVLLAADRSSGTVVIVGAPDSQSSTLTRLTPAGASRQIPVPTATRISAVCTGPDGRAWISFDNVVARIEDDDSITAFATGLRPPPNDIAGMADDGAGNLWFTDWFTHRVTRLRPDGRLAGHLMAYRGLQFASRPVRLIRGPQRSMWYTANTPSQLVRVGPDGRVSAFDVEAEFPFAIAEGPDGALWFTDIHANHLWRAMPPDVPPPPTPLPTAPRFYVGSQFFNEITVLDIDGDAQSVFPVAREAFSLSDVGASSDGRTLFVALGYSVQAIDVRAQRVLRTYPVPGDGLTLSPDGAHAYLWFRFTDFPMLVLDLRTGAVVDALGAGRRYAVTVGPDGHLYVPVLPEDEATPPTVIEVIDPDAGGTVDAITVPHVGTVFLNRAGTRAYVPGPLPEFGEYAHGFRVLDVATRAVLDRQALQCGITAVVPSLDDRMAYVVCQSRQVEAYDVEARQIVASTGPQTRGNIVAAALSPDGNTLALVDYSYGVHLVDTRALAFTRQIPESVHAGEPVSYEGVDIAAVDPTRPTCIGDCNGDGEVTIDEVISGVQTALDDSPACPGYPAVAGEVTISDLIGAVNAALYGCAGGGAAPGR